MKKQNTSTASNAIVTPEFANLLPVISKARDALNTIVKAAQESGGSRISSGAALEIIKDLTSRLDALAQLRTSLGTIESELAKQVERNFQELEVALREECNRRRWTVDGQWPIFYIQRGVTVELDSRQRVASVGGKKQSNADLATIVAALEPLVARLLPKEFSANVFMGQLVSAYERARKTTTQVPILDVYREVVIQQQSPRFWRDADPQLFVAIGADQFRARLSKMMEIGVTEASDGRALRLLPPLNPKDGLFMFLPTESRFAYVGRVEFIESVDPVKV